jgi:hypothetical protein
MIIRSVDGKPMTLPPYGGFLAPPWPEERPPAPDRLHPGRRELRAVTARTTPSLPEERPPAPVAARGGARVHAVHGLGKKKKKKGERNERKKWWVVEIFTMGKSSFLWWRIGGFFPSVRTSAPEHYRP